MTTAYDAEGMDQAVAFDILQVQVKTVCGRPYLRDDAILQPRHKALLKGDAIGHECLKWDRVANVPIGQAAFSAETSQCHLAGGVIQI